MQKGRWLAVGCTAVFAIPFCLAGIGVMLDVPRATARDAAISIGVGSAFLLAGLGLLVGVIIATGAAQNTFVLRAQNPDKPWLWRKDWAAGAAQESGSARLAFLWMFAVLWNAVSIPAAFVLPLREARQQPVLYVVLIFPLIGLALLFAALYGTLRRMRYGASVCHLDRVPIAPGQAFHGEIDTHVHEPPPNGFLVRLSCVRRVSRGRNSTESLLWRDEQTVAYAAPSPAGMRVPFTFTLPRDAEPTALTAPGVSTYWRLDIRAEVPGIDYAAMFDLPVFGAAVDAVSDEPREPSWPAPQADPLSWTPERSSRIAIAPLPSGGEEYRSGPMRGSGGCGLGIFTTIWFGVIALMTRLGAPVFIPLLFGAFGLFILIATLDFFLGRTTARVDRTRVALRRAWLGLGGTRTIDASAVTDVVTSIGMTQGGGSGTPYYDVEIRAGGKKYDVAKYVPSKRDAEMLAARVRRAMGRT
jgi:hypothetical protein